MVMRALVACFDRNGDGVEIWVNLRQSVKDGLCPPGGRQVVVDRRVLVSMGDECGEGYFLDNLPKLEARYFTVKVLVAGGYLTSDHRPQEVHPTLGVLKAPAVSGVGIRKGH